MTLDLSEPIIDLEGDVKATISVLLEEKVIKKSPTQEQILAIAYTIQRKYDFQDWIESLIVEQLNSTFLTEQKENQERFTWFYG